jgi:hypothetical protein
MNSITPQVEELAKDWFRRCRESQMVHYEYGSLLERRHLFFGVPAIVLSTIVGTAIFSSREASADKEFLKIFFGLLSMLSASITALQTFLNLADRASKHKAAGAKYGAIRRDLELLKQVPPTSEEDVRARLESIKIQMDELASNAPGVPSMFKQKIDERLKSKSHNRIYQLDPSLSSTLGDKNRPINIHKEVSL